jgi:hypothetical protein
VLPAQRAGHSPEDLDDLVTAHLDEMAARGGALPPPLPDPPPVAVQLDPLPVMRAADMRREIADLRAQVAKLQASHHRQIQHVRTCEVAPLVLAVVKVKAHAARTDLERDRTRKVLRAALLPLVGAGDASAHAACAAVHALDPAFLTPAFLYPDDDAAGAKPDPTPP